MQLTILLQDVSSLYDNIREAQEKTQSFVQILQYLSIAFLIYFIIREYGWWTWRAKFTALSDVYLEKNKPKDRIAHRTACPKCNKELIQFNYEGTEFKCLECGQIYK